jgi:hypothetical protein
VRSKASLTLAPATSSRDAIERTVREGDPTVCSEMIRILPGLPGPLDTPAGWLKIFNTLHAVSAMKGMTYWSVTHRQVRVLFTQSYAIDSPQRPSRIPDPLRSAVPAEDILYSYQEDSTFGKNVYRATFNFRGDHCHERLENLSTITYALFPIVQPRNFVSHIVLIPSGGELLFYGVSYIHTTLPFGDKRSREESLFNRLIALSDWLKALISTGRSP